MLCYTAATDFNSDAVEESDIKLLCNKKGVRSLMFRELKEINSRTAPFQFYTGDELWANEHTSKQMLEYRLNESIDVSSRNRSFIESCLKWIVSHFRVDKNTEIADFG